MKSWKEPPVARAKNTCYPDDVRRTPDSKKVVVQFEDVLCKSTPVQFNNSVARVNEFRTPFQFDPVARVEERLDTIAISGKASSRVLRA